MLGYILILMIATLAISTWSHQRGTGFWFAFFWSFLLSPVLGAMLVLIRRPHGRVLTIGGIAVVEDPAAPRPGFCMAMIFAIFFAILVWANI